MCDKVEEQLTRVKHRKVSIEYTTRVLFTVTEHRNFSRVQLLEARARALRWLTYHTRVITINPVAQQDASR